MWNPVEKDFANVAAVEDALQVASRKLEFTVVLARIGRYTLSDPARERIELLRPSTDRGWISSELKRVSEMKLIVESDDDLPLDSIKDVRPSLRRATIENSVLSPGELLDVYKVLQTSRLVRAYFQKRLNRYPRLYELAKGLYTDRVLEHNIERTISESGTVKDSASHVLASVRQEIARRSELLRQKLEAILRSAAADGMIQEEIITTRDGRMVIPVKAEHKHHVPGFIHSTSASGATVFIEPAETLEMNNEIRSLRFDEEREIERLLRELTAQVGSVQDKILSSFHLLVELDVLRAKAKYSIEILGSEPQIATQYTIRLIDARHPLLLLKHGLNGVVPLSFEIDQSIRTVVISGPNAGGKTVALKTIGLLVLMMQAGLHIPAHADSSIPVFDKILVDLGDDQSVESDLSTFSSHMLNLKSFMETASPGTLILIDEIGADTDPTEGGAIAAAVLEELTSTGAISIATTHHGFLKAFAADTPGVMNASMEFDQRSLSPTFRYRPGVPGSSYAIEIAQRLGIPRGVIARSRKFIGEVPTKLELLLASTEQKSQDLERRLKQIERDELHLRQLISLHERRDRELKEKTNLIKQEALKSAQELLQQTNRTIEQTIKEIRDSQAEKLTVQKARASIRELRASVEAELERIETEKRKDEEAPITAGSFVKLKGSTEIGEVLQVDEKSHEALVAFNSLKLHVPLERLQITYSKPDSLQSLHSISSDREISNEIDIRGMGAHEAVSLVDRFLDKAFLAGLHRVRIIHGKGTGRLRSRISELLSRDKRIESYRLGDWNEGGSGVTVVELHKD